MNNKNHNFRKTITHIFNGIDKFKIESIFEMNLKDELNEKNF